MTMGVVAAPTQRREPSWRPCPTCWGQRRLLRAVRRPNGELIGHVGETCGTCGGIGEVVSAASGRAEVVRHEPEEEA